MTDLNKLAEKAHAKSDAFRYCAGEPTYKDLLEGLINIFRAAPINDNLEIFINKLQSMAADTVNNVKGNN